MGIERGGWSKPDKYFPWYCRIVQSEVDNGIGSGLIGCSPSGLVVLYEWGFFVGIGKQRGARKEPRWSVNRLWDRRRYKGLGTATLGLGDKDGGGAGLESGLDQDDGWGFREGGEQVRL